MSGNDLFVANYIDDTVGEYDATTGSRNQCQLHLAKLAELPTSVPDLYFDYLRRLNRSEDTGGTCLKPRNVWGA